MRLKRFWLSSKSSVWQRNYSLSCKGCGPKPTTKLFFKVSGRRWQKNEERRKKIAWKKINFTWTVLKEEDRWFGWFLLCSAAMVKKSLRIWWWHPNSMKLHGWPQNKHIVRHTILGTKISAPRGQPSLSGSVGRGMRWLFSDTMLHQVLSSDNIRFQQKEHPSSWMIFPQKKYMR